MNNCITDSQIEPVVIFVHIPKTAGTTLRHIIQYQLPPKYTFEFYRLAKTKNRKGIDEFQNLSAARKNTIKLISGHVGYGLHEFLHRPYTYITVLRDPVDRVVSYYYHLLQTNHKAVQNKTLADFVQTSGGAQNSMTKLLSGVKLQQLLRESQGSELNEISLDSSLNSTEILEMAKINLKNDFRVVGLVEKFDETLILLKRVLGWRIPASYVKSNVTKKRLLRSKLSPETIALIEKHNELDVQLYEYGKGIFDQLVDQNDFSFSKELEELKSANESSKSKLYFTIRSSYTRFLYRTHELITSF